MADTRSSSSVRTIPRLVILDLMLPEMSGLDVVRSIRQNLDGPDHHRDGKGFGGRKVTGLELGADDYVTKPFSVRELVSRCGHLRRSRMTGAPQAEEVLTAARSRWTSAATK